ncbi:MAG: flagellar hook-basal body complex protein [Fuerstiella sp.]|nr:flagellar hook-basal body complex protein [Fuerstiella sp.]MCP4853983.1 flagellar hook-basal body complex protein [Fuerstiella sp.]
MANSLLTGISGLRGHQKMLEVIGNNLANVNTTAFKSSRTLFSDLIYEGQRGASSGTAGTLGSINPLQIGTGSQVTSVDRNFRQGNLESTGEDLDAAIDGNGFFVAESGSGRVYTRAGSFSIDESGFLVDPSTGYLLQRFGTVGENPADGPAFQVPGDARIQIPIGASILGTVTTQIELSGQLGAASTGPTQRVIGGTALTTGGGTTPATGATLLNSLDSSTTPYIGGDRILITGQQADGTQIISSLNVDGTTTVQNLLDHLTTLYPASVVSLEGSAVTVTANGTGMTTASLTIQDDVTNTGFQDAQFTNQFTQTAIGADATVVGGSLPIYDERGTEHTLGYSLTKQVDESWTLAVTLPPSAGTIIDGLIEGIQFGADGSLTQVTGVGVGDGNISVLFENSTAAQSMDVDLGTLGDIDGLSEIGDGASISFLADGYGPGELVAVQIDADGTLSGVGSNGLKFSIAQLAIAAFSNPDGLLNGGGNYYKSSLASGNAEIGTALNGDRGAIRAAQLEGSNVDLALEFTKLLVAQRGFSANARTITVTDEVLEELTNIIR